MRGGLLACVTVLPLLLLIANVLQYFVTQQSAVSAAPIRRAKLFRAASTIVAAIPPPPPPPPPPPSPTSSQSSSSSSATIAANLCNATAHIELWGSVVLPGSDNPQPSAEACCAACRAYVPVMDIGAGAQCNTFVWHLDPPHECWLKNQQPDALARAAKSLEALRGKPPQNPKLRWVSGVVLEKKACADCEATVLLWLHRQGQVQHDARVRLARHRRLRTRRPEVLRHVTHDAAVSRGAQCWHQARRLSRGGGGL